MKNEQLEWYVLFLEEYIKDLESESVIKKILDDFKKFESPVSPWKKNDDIYPKIFEFNICPKCGLKLEGVMSYCCPNVECPTGMGPVMCKA